MMQLARQQLSALQEELRDIEETEAEMAKAKIMKHVDALQSILGSAKKLFEAGARMTLNAILLTFADISLDMKEKYPVAIFPNMQIASSDGVLVKNPVNQFEVWLTGNVDYGVCTYKDEANRARVLEAPLGDLMTYIENCIILVEAKRDKEMFIDSMPEATSQAIALSEMFHVYTSDGQGNRVSYEGPIVTIAQPHLEVGEDFKKDVRRVVELLYHWLRTDVDIKDDPLCTLRV